MRIARATCQSLLLDVLPKYRLGSNADARNAYGSAAQEVVCAALAVHPIAINGNCEVCFDAEGHGLFYEIKSVRQGCKVVVYDCRMTKEETAGVPLLYALLVHHMKGLRTSAAMWESLAGKTEILLVPAPVIHALARDEPLRTLGNPSDDPRNGYSRKGYKDGYRNLPVNKIRQLQSTQREHHFSLHGMEFSTRITKVCH